MHTKVACGCKTNDFMIDTNLRQLTRCLDGEKMYHIGIIRTRFSQDEESMQAAWRDAWLAYQRSYQIVMLFLAR